MVVRIVNLVTMMVSRNNECIMIVIMTVVLVMMIRMMLVRQRG
jgi:hypothetical protein